MYLVSLWDQKMIKFAAEIHCILLEFSFSRSGSNFPCDPHEQTHSTDQEEQRVCDAVWMYSEYLMSAFEGCISKTN